MPLSGVCKLAILTASNDSAERHKCGARLTHNYGHIDGDTLPSSINTIVIVQFATTNHYMLDYVVITITD